MYYTRNSDLTYYETNRNEVNCGSYALRLNEWYSPEGYFEDTVGSYIEDWIIEMGECGHTNEEISNVFGDILVEGILSEFDGELEPCDGRPPTTSDVELVSFNTFCIYEENEYPDYDFHFKVLRDGKWMEKHGPCPVCECDEFDWGRYIGKATYFYHKIGEKEC